MTTRDSWARLTPYEVGIPGRAFAERVFGAIRDEAKSREEDLANPASFVLLGEVGRALREIQGDERGGEAIHRFAALLFHAYHFHRAGEPILLIETDLARHLVEGEGHFTEWRGELPSDAGYLQLPRHLFWAHPTGETEPAEPLDGMFWTRSSGETLSLLLALGVRADRPGISVIEVPPLPLADAPKWVAQAAREGDSDFATTLPGGEIDGLYSVVTMGEALKLAGRAFGYLTTHPGALGVEERAPGPDDARGDSSGPRPSLLAFRRVGMDGGIDRGEEHRGHLDETAEVYEAMEGDEPGGGD